MTGKPKSDLNDIRLLVLDVDGVLTDGTVILSADGSEATLNLHDGHGIKLWHRAGLQTAFISGREAKATTVRAEQLNITYIMQGQMHKLPAFESLLAQADLEARRRPTWATTCWICRWSCGPAWGGGRQCGGGTQGAADMVTKQWRG